MNVPGALRDVDGRDVLIRTDEYEDGSAIVVDFGPSRRASVDVVGDAAIVVVDDEQFEFELPPEATSVTAANGVLTIEERPSRTDDEE